jgi:hypothetical protein
MKKLLCYLKNICGFMSDQTVRVLFEFKNRSIELYWAENTFLLFQMITVKVNICTNHEILKL